jgi:hypothetical protein
LRGEILEFEEHTLKTDPYTENKGLDRRLDCSNEDETSSEKLLSWPAFDKILLIPCSVLLF